MPYPLIAFRVTEQEKAMLEAHARGAGLSVSEWIRKKVLIAADKDAAELWEATVDKALRDGSLDEPIVTAIDSEAKPPRRWICTTPKCGAANHNRAICRRCDRPYKP